MKGGIADGGRRICLDCKKYMRLVFNYGTETMMKFK